MIRKSVHEIAEIFSAFEVRGEKEFNNSFGFKLSSYRIKNFYHNGIECVKCGVKGNYFINEKYKGNSGWHLNLYANRSGGKSLMTVDYIIPKSLGGTSTIKNLQTMCSSCNGRKGCSLLPEDIELVKDRYRKDFYRRILSVDMWIQMFKYIIRVKKLPTLPMLYPNFVKNCKVNHNRHDPYQ